MNKRWWWWPYIPWIIVIGVLIAMTATPQKCGGQWLDPDDDVLPPEIAEQAARLLEP